MARLVTDGCEDTVHVNSTDATWPGLRSVAGAVTRDTTVFRSGLASWKFDTGAGPSNAYARMGFTPAAGTYFIRAYIKYTGALPTAGDRPILGNVSTVTDQIAVTVDGNGQLKIFAAGAAFGNPSINVCDGNWHRVEWKLTLTSTTVITTQELMVDGVVVQSWSGSQTISSALALYVGWSNAAVGASRVLNVDDFAVNDASGTIQNNYPGDGKVVLLLPISDNTRGANWVGGGGGTASLFLAVDNTPPVGVATPGTNTSQIRNVTKDTTGNYDANLQSYTTAGVPAGAVVSLVQGLWNIGGGATGDAMQIVSNPVVGAASTASPATTLGTWPTGWSWQAPAGQIVYNPSVTLGTSPVIRIGKRLNATTEVACDFMGLQVEYIVPPSFPDSSVQDNFNRANQSPPGSFWVNVLGSWVVAGNQALNNSGGWGGMYWNAPVLADHEVYVTIAGLGANLKALQLHVRRDSGADTGYFLNLIPDVGTTYWEAWRRVSGADTQLTPTVQKLVAAGDSVGVEIVGSTIYFWHKPAAGSWSLVMWRNDATVTAPGRVAIYSNDVSWIIDDFGGPLAGTPISGSDVGSGSAETTAIVQRLDKVGTDVAASAEAHPSVPYTDAILPFKSSQVLLTMLGLQELSGNVANDLSGMNENGQYVGLPVLGAASVLPAYPLLKSMQFDGVNDYVLGASATPFVATALTLEGWAVRDSDTTEDTLWGSTTAPNQLLMRQNAGGNNITFWNNAATGSVTWTNATPGPGIPFHWVLTYGDSTKVAELFINGVSQGTKTLPSGKGTTPGNLEWGAWGNVNDPYLGRMAYLAWYSTILSAANILAHYNAGRSGVGAFVTYPPFITADVGVGADSGAPIIPKSAAETGAGVDALLGLAVAGWDTNAGVVEGKQLIDRTAGIYGGETYGFALYGGVAATQIVSSDVGAGSEAGVVPFSPSGLDNGSDTETALRTATLFLAETAAGADFASFISAQLAATDVGAGAELGSLGSVQIGSDAGSGVDSSFVNLFRAGTDVNGVVTENAVFVAVNAVPVSDVGAGSELSQLLAILGGIETGSGADFGSGTGGNNFAGLDVGSGAELAARIAGIPSSDVAAGSELATMIGQLLGSDSGTSVESSGSIAGSSGNELGQGAEAPSLKAVLGGSDIGSSAENASATVFNIVLGTDTGVGVESVQLLAILSGSQSGTGADSGSFAGIWAGSDNGFSADTATMRFAASTTDTGAGSETLYLIVSRVGADSGTGAEARLLAALYLSFDVGAGVEAEKIAVAIQADEEILVEELATMFTAYANVDYGTGVDLGNKIIGQTLQVIRTGRVAQPQAGDAEDAERPLVGAVVQSRAGNIDGYPEEGTAEDSDPGEVVVWPL